MIRTSLTTFTISTTALLMLAACSQSGAAINQTDGSKPSSTDKSGTLVYYLDQTSTASGDQNEAVKQYEDVLANCKMMHAAITPLSSADLVKLSEVHQQTWQAEGRRAKRTDEWDPVTADGSMEESLCHFTGVKMRSKVVIDVAPDKIYSLDLTKGTGTMQTVSGDVMPAMPAITSTMEAAAERKAQFDGMVKLGVSRIAGQPCVMWRYGSPGEAGSHTECVWSGGEQWGYSAAGGPTLWSKTLDSATGAVELTTAAMIIGHLPDGGKNLQVPSNIAVRNESGP